MQIHPTAIVDPNAHLEEGVIVGPGVVIGPHVWIGEGTQIGPHVVIQPYTCIGRYCKIRAGAVLGGTPQDLKFRGERSFLEIGDENEICEFVTIHRATGEDERTLIGNRNLIMAYAHIGHNCRVGNENSIASYVGICGHVTIEDKVVIGGMVGIHQYVRVGKLAMIGGFSKVVQDVPPFMMVDGRPAKPYDVNVRGLRRAGLPPRIRASLRQAFKFLYRSNLSLAQALEAIENEIEISPERDYLLSFLHAVRLGYGGRGNDPNRPPLEPVEQFILMSEADEGD